ncbi:MAG: dinitrogenase iron-molybdenum cofactor biosynthesis protein [Bacteroidetes bacterium]|nr:MAG: dinitrogenase iron-molybdenum cofactor biosynthesis protein [Bacteroidota bacterium]
MKVAITSTGNRLESSIDPRFGRCAFFAIHDLETGSTEFLPNPNKNATNGAGPASVKFVADHRVAKIVSGEFGMKIKSILDSLSIQMISVKDHAKTVEEIITMLNH